MTVLHIASPFAFSMPVSEGQGGAALKDGEEERAQEPGQAATGREAGSAAASRENGIVDARDGRVAFARAVDLASPSTDIAAVAGSLEAVLAAYQPGQQGAAADAQD